MPFPFPQPPTPPSTSTSRISPPHLLAVQTSSAALQSHLGIHNPSISAPPPLPVVAGSALGPQTNANAHAPPLPREPGSASTSVMMAVRAVTFHEMNTNPELGREGQGKGVREGVLKRVVVGEGGVTGLSVSVGRRVRVGEGEGQGEGEKWVFVNVVWETEGGRSGERRMLFAEGGLRAGVGGKVEGEGRGLMETAAFEGMLARGNGVRFEGAGAGGVMDVETDIWMDEGEKGGEGGVHGRQEGEHKDEDEVEGEEEVEGDGGAEGEGEGDGEGMDVVEAGLEGEEHGDEEEREVEGGVHGRGRAGPGTEGDGNGDWKEEEEWRSVKRAMERGSCFVRFYL